MYNIFRILLEVPDYSSSFFFVFLSKNEEEAIPPGGKSCSTIGGGGDVTNLPPFWEGTAQKQPLPVTYLTNPL